MTNSIIKNKSKILLIILCLLGIIFSYSCSCRNEATKPPIEKGTFSPYSDLTSKYNLSFGSDGKEKLQSVVKFKDDNGYKFKVKIIKVQDPKNKLTAENIQINDDGTIHAPEETLKDLSEALGETSDKPLTNEEL